jgi:hypothetical protein
VTVNLAIVTLALFEGIESYGGTATVSDNAIHGNGLAIFTRDPFSGTIEKNDIFGNFGCGIQNGNTGGSIQYTGVNRVGCQEQLLGAATGRGPNPADDAGSAHCNPHGGSTTSHRSRRSRLA